MYRLLYFKFCIFFKAVRSKHGRGANSKVFTTERGVAVNFQFIVQAVRIMTLKQEETWSNKAIGMARRLV